VRGDEQVVSSVGFHSRIAAFADALSVLGERAKVLFENPVACNNSTDTAFVTLIAKVYPHFKC
jgi:hypothetical protein